MSGHGIIVDKPGGMTSHDVVWKARRALRTKEIGHAGTLDPMATGVLVLLVGQATKLASYITLEDKAYEAELALGKDTASHDRDGEVVREREVSLDVVRALEAIDRGEAWGGALAAALGAERARSAQTPPIVSAIHVDGKRSHALARAGESPTLAPRGVRVDALDVLGADPIARTLRVRVVVSKGYYVRALARDLGESIGAGAHLTALRRVASGAFTLADAVTLDELAARADRRMDLVALARRSFGALELTDEGATRARVGKALAREHFVAASEPATTARLWIAPGGRPVAIGAAAEGEPATWRVLRGIVPGGHDVAPRA